MHSYAIGLTGENSKPILFTCVSMKCCKRVPILGMSGVIVSLPLWIYGQSGVVGCSMHRCCDIVGTL